jgi:hypothetical protein
MWKHKSPTIHVIYDPGGKLCLPTKEFMEKTEIKVAVLSVSRHLTKLEIVEVAEKLIVLLAEAMG